MSGIKNSKHVDEFIYDFAVDGGANGSAIDLHDKAGKAVIPVGAIITAVTVKVVTACTSDGQATVEWGNGDDANGYSGTAIAVASLTNNAVFNGWDNGAELLWDDANDHAIYQNVSTAADGQVKLLINVADLTAGKIVILVEYYLPTVA